MKKILFLLVSALTICNAYTQMSGLLINENFSGYSNGNLNTASGGQGLWKASFNGNSTDFVQVAVSPPLMYPDYTSGTQYINVKQKGYHLAESDKLPDDPSKAFTSGIVPIHADNTTFYYSFLVRVPLVSGVSTTGDARPNIALRSLNGGVFANFYIAAAGNGTQLKFGINKNGSASGMFAPAAYNFNTTYLIVIRYDVANGETSPDYDDKMYLWINPSLSAEPSPASAAVAIDNTLDFNFDGGLDAPAESLQLFQDSTSAAASFDAFKVAYAQGYSADKENSAAAWNALSPAGEPLPVKFSDFKGYIKDKRIELDWRVDFEFNVLRYEVERSGNGVSFSYAGNVAAKNEGNESGYKWIDATPGTGNNYYRIKNIYKTGDAVYSSVVRLSVKDQAISFVVFPNPALHSNVSLQATGLQPGHYTLELFNAEGQVLFKEPFIHAGGSCNRALVLPPTLRGGIYTIQLTGTGFRQAVTAVVQ